VLEGKSAGRGARGDIQLGEDVLQVAGDRVLADRQLRRDLAVAAAGGDQAQDLELALAEAVAIGAVSRRKQQRFDPGEVARRTERGEGVARGFQLELRRVLVAERAAGATDRLPSAGFGMGSVQIGPCPRGLAERGQRLARPPGTRWSAGCSGS